MFRDGPERLLVFRVGAERFAVPLGAVDEVMDTPVIQRLPDASPTLLGLATLRDELVMVYDARPLLHPSGAGASGSARSAATTGALLLFQRDARRVGLAIDDVHDAILVDEQEVRPLPGGDVSDRTLVGLVRRNSDLIAILDADAMLDAATASVTSGTIAADHGVPAGGGRA